MRNYLAVLFLAITLTGCGSMNSSFDCPNKAGVNCRSLDQINSMVDSGQIASTDPSSIASSVSNTDFSSFPMTSTTMAGQPLRYGETVQRIWVAPYEDSEGNYHQDSLMYSIIKGGHWIGKPAKALQAV